MKMTDKYLFFWNGPFSQWHLSTFVVDGVMFNCCEQYMMYMKAKCFGDTDSMRAIIDEETPKVQKDLGRLVKGFDSDKWDRVKEDIVFNGNLAKFTQNISLMCLMLDTHDVMFVEASPYDRIWGIGMRETDRGVEDPDNWKGQNLLGKALTDVRRSIRDGIAVSVKMNHKTINI